MRLLTTDYPLASLKRRELVLAKEYDRKLRKLQGHRDAWKNTVIIIVSIILGYLLMGVALAEPITTYTDCHTDTECANCDLMRDIVDEWTYPNYLYEEAQAFDWNEIVND